jgi:anaerobic selenocysteine-containing dehydrogenase
MKWAGVTGVGAVIFNGCRVDDSEIRVQSPVELPEDLVTGRDNYYATVAQYSGASEGILVRVMEGRAKKVEGNPDYPVNRGKHHFRTEALLQAAYHPDRIKSPLARIAKGGPFRRISWPDSLDRLATLLKERQGDDPSSVLLATTPVRGRLADVINGFATAYGAQLLGFDPLDETVLRMAMKEVYGQDVLPDFDIANADFLVSFGSDFLGTWMNPTRQMRNYGAFRQGSSIRGHLVQVDSRFSTSAAAADDWVYVTPGSEGLLAMAMAYHIIDKGLVHSDSKALVRKLTSGSGSPGPRFAPSTAADATGISAARIEALAEAFAAAEHPLAIGGGSAAAHTNGLFNLKAIYSLNYLVGAVNKPGGIIFNPAGSTSRVLAAPLRDWRSEMERMRSGEIKLLLVRDANLAYALPGALDPKGALDGVETIVSFSSFLDETTARADLILPGHTPLEEWGSDTAEPGPGYQTVAFQQPVINRFRDTVAFGDVLLQMAHEVGLEAELPWANMRDAVREYVRGLHGMKKGSVLEEFRKDRPGADPTFEEFWKRALELGGWWDDSSQVSDTAAPTPLPPRPVEATLAGDDRYPLTLVPFEGHGVGGGQFAHLPWAQAVPDPITTVAWATWVSLNPHTAEAMGLRLNDLVTIEASTGRTIYASVYMNPATPTNVAEVPLGQGHDHYTSYAAGRGGNLWDILDPSEDEATGAWAWAATRVRIIDSNRAKNLPKLEGNEEARQLEHEPVIEVLRQHDA